jgi:hypothetical protein
VAVRSVTFFAVTSTIATSPRFRKWESFGIACLAELRKLLRYRRKNHSG